MGGWSGGAGGGGAGQRGYYPSHRAEWLAPLSGHKGVVTAEPEGGPSEEWWPSGVAGCC